MKSIVINRKSKDEPISVLQITDTHLLGDTSKNFLGINTYESLKTVIDTIKNQNLHYDFVIMTGDISQDFSIESYKTFVNIMEELEAPVFVLPGNHDSHQIMYEVLDNSFVSLDKHIICDNWQFISLSSTVYEKAYGFVEEKEIEFLKDCYYKNEHLNTVVCVHHLPKLVGSKWLDTQTMKNQDYFNDVLKTMPNVKLVLSGHVHQEYDCVIDNIRYMASPSTSIQFEPKSEMFSLDTAAPGWRYLIFNKNGTIKTSITRLPKGRFVPEKNILGY